MAAPKILVMDGADGTRTQVMLFPSDWTFEDANRLYFDALKGGQAGDDWGWEEIEQAMVARGFIMPNRHDASHPWDEPPTHEAEGDEG